MRFTYVIVNFETRTVRVTENAREAYNASKLGNTQVVSLPLPEFVEPQLTSGPPPTHPKPRLVLDRDQLGKDLDQPLKWD